MINIKVEFKDDDGDIQTMQSYMPVTDFKVIKGNENKEVNVCKEIICFISVNLHYYTFNFKKTIKTINNEEIKRVIDLLKDKSYDPMPILEDLNIILDKCLIF